MSFISNSRERLKIEFRNADEAIIGKPIILKHLGHLARLGFRASILRSNVKIVFLGRYDPVNVELPVMKPEDRSDLIEDIHLSLIKLPPVDKADNSHLADIQRAKSETLINMSYQVIAQFSQMQEDMVVQYSIQPIYDQASPED